jgi:hypothetical protein
VTRGISSMLEALCHGSAAWHRSQATIVFTSTVSSPSASLFWKAIAYASSILEGSVRANLAQETRGSIPQRD